MPTRRGRATLAAALACFFLARTIGVAELYAVSLAGALLVGLAAVAVRWARYRLAFSRRLVPPRAFPDNAFRVELTVRNAGRMASPPLLVEDSMPESLGGASRFAVDTLAPDRVRTFTTDRLATARGRYRIGPLLVRLIDPFGLAEITTTNKREDLLIVYPRIESVGRGVPPSQRAGAGPARVTRLSPEGEEFYAVREYQDGDDLRKIHWSSVARTGTLMIRQEEARLHPRATLLLDTRAGVHRGAGRHSSLEWSIGAVASLAWHLGRSGFSLRLATDAAGPSSILMGKAATDGILETLAGIEATQRGGIVPVLRRLGRKPSAGGALVAVLPPPSPEDLRVLARLRIAYVWCGAILVDTESFVAVSARARAQADQRAAAAEITLSRAGWQVHTAGSTEGIAEAWTNLLAGPASRRRSASSFS